jgi:hypothetical protein
MVGQCLPMLNLAFLLHTDGAQLLNPNFLFALWIVTTLALVNLEPIEEHGPQSYQ